MGKNLIQQRRGKGNTRYRSPSHRFIGKIRYGPLEKREGEVVDIVHSAGKRTPVAVVKYGDKKEFMIPAENTCLGQRIMYGSEIGIGNVVNVGSVPEGTRIFNIERTPGDGGKLCRSPGTSAVVVSRDGDRCVIKLPSKKQITIRANCRSTVGVPAGYGKKNKPLMKAGNKHNVLRSVGKLYPKVSGTSMNAVDHPFGGSNFGKRKTVSRHASPGRKVGSLSAKKTGKKKR